jgi:glycerophosphoryl diester phosphodiesterase
MKKTCFVIFAMAFQLGTQAQKGLVSQKEISKHFEWSLKVLNDVNTKKILVTAHRFGWRNAPENSIQSLKECIKGGIDIGEFDLKQTKDGHLIAMHDKTIDRTTNGKGKPEDYTLEDIRKFRLKDGAGHITRHQIPTLEEVLEVAKDKIILNVDKGFPYFNQAVKMIVKYGMQRQVIYNIADNIPLDTVLERVRNMLANYTPFENQATFKELPEGMFLMTVVDPSSPKTDAVIASFKTYRRSIIQTVFAADTVRVLNSIPQIRRQYHVWFNSLWPEHSANHDDDIAVEENKPDETWGWLIKKGASILQSDRPYDLLKYLKKKGFHY